MAIDFLKKRIVPPVMTHEEKIARERTIYPQAGTGYDIPFQIFYSKKTLAGYLIANQVKHMMGYPGTFLVFWDNRFRGIINYTSDGWIMERTDPDLLYALGEWIILWYE